MAETMADLFLLPFLTGLAVAVALPVLGCYLRLREEWLAALAYANVAAAGALAAQAGGLPLPAGGIGASAVAALGKRLAMPRLGQGAAFALLFICGWAVAVLLTANMPLAERLGHALFDGQLYFTDGASCLLAWASIVVLLPILRVLSKRLLLARIYPHHAHLQGGAAWPIETGFDLLAVAILAIATMSVGVMATFAMIFVPAWIAFARSAGWRRGIALSSLVGLSAYGIAFAVALHFDQPFGPVMAIVLAVAGILLYPRR